MKSDHSLFKIVIFLIAAFSARLGTSFTGKSCRITSRNTLFGAMRSFPDQKNIEEAAKVAVIAAGKIILDGSGKIDLSSGTKSKIGSRDIVTDCDVNAQNKIKEIVSGFYPSHKFLGEEDIAPGREAGAKAIDEKMHEEHLWIIDPIDGTTNFAHGQSLCGVILAYASKGYSRGTYYRDVRLITNECLFSC